MASSLTYTKTSDEYDITTTPSVDRSVITKDYNVYYTQSQAQLNNNGAVFRIVIPKDIYMNMNNAFLEVHFRVDESGGGGGAAGDSYADGNVIALVNCGVWFLFNRVTLSTSAGSGQALEACNNPGLTAVIYNILTKKSNELMSYFAKDTPVGTVHADNLGFVAKRNRILNDVDQNESYM